MPRKGVTWKDGITVIESLTRVGNPEFKDPAALIEGPEQTWSISVSLIRPEPEHHPAHEESGNTVDVSLVEVGMFVAVRPFFILSCIRAEPVGRRVVFVLGVSAIRYAS